MGDAASPGYVYYNRIYTDFYGDDSAKGRSMMRKYYGAKSAISFYGVRDSASDSRNKRIKEVSEYLKRQGRAEFEKEKKLLMYKYPELFAAHKVDFELGDKDSMMKFIQIYSEMLSSKDIFESAISRMSAALTSDGSKKVGATVWRYFPTYLSNAMTKFLQIREEDLANQVKIDEEGFPDYLHDLLESNLDDIMDDAIDRMLRSKRTNKSKDQTQPYLEFRKALNANPQCKAVFRAGLQKIYGLSGIIDRLSENFSTDISSNWIGKSGKKSVSFSSSLESKVQIKVGLNRGGGQQGGLATEEAAAQLVKVLNEDMSAVRTGQTNVKADYIISIGGWGLDDLDLEESVNSVGRERGQQLVDAIDKILDDYDKGFLIYVNAKDYMTATTDDFRGFKSGEDIKLSKYQSLSLRSETSAASVNKFVGAIMNTMKGAVGEKYQRDLTTLLAGDLAAFLFDDFKTIGDNAPQDSVNRLHLFLLNSVYVPLSYLLYWSGIAIEEAADGRNINNYFSASISNVEISYPDPPYNSAMWEQQRTDALEKIKVGGKFLKNFSDIVAELAPN